MTPFHSRLSIRHTNTLPIYLALSLSLSCRPSDSHANTEEAANESGTPEKRTGDRADSDRPDFIKRQETFEGTVEEALPAGSYTYFSVRLDSGAHRWAVVLGGKEQREQSRLRFKSFGLRHDFPSPRLDRSFDEIYFCSLSPAS